MSAKPQSYKNYIFKQKIIPYLFLTPNLIIFSVFIIIPALIGVYYSFTNVTLFTFGSQKFVGLDNYAKLIDNEYFINALKNILKLVIVTVPLMFATALGLAILLVQPLRAKGAFRAIYYWPVMISAVVVGIMWNWIFAGNFGLLNTTLKGIQSLLNSVNIFGTFDFAPVRTLSNPRFAWWSVVYVTIWSRSGYYMIIFIAALLSIPESLYEAAEMDGANKIQKFLYITYPALKPARLMVFILVTMEVFKTYPLVVTLTGGGPHRATIFTVQYIYEVAFKEYQVGYASAMSVIMLLIVTIFTAFIFFWSKRGESK